MAFFAIMTSTVGLASVTLLPSRTEVVIDENASSIVRYAASTPLFGISRQTLIAHRGHVALSTTVAQPPENTLASIDEAVAEGFGFECDVLYTKDGRVFTMHDGCFKRVYDIDSEDYASMTWDYVSHLVPIDCSGRRHPETRAALFEEVCGRARDGRRGRVWDRLHGRAARP